MSSLHIPESHPNILLSGGGEPNLNIWDWTTGEQLAQVEVATAVLPHRRVKAEPRRIKRQKRLGKEPASRAVDTSAAVLGESLDVGKGDKGSLNGSDHVDSNGRAEEGTEEWYTAPEGWMLPSGQGLCIKSINSLRIGDRTIVLFFSLGYVNLSLQ